MVLTAALALATAAAGCVHGPKLPEADSPAAQLYVARCGVCHGVYSPGTMTAAMWSTQVDAMMQEMAEAGTPPLAPEERRQILGYLTRNAGKD